MVVIAAVENNFKDTVSPYILFIFGGVMAS